jgi:VanZ family protein
VKARVLPGLRYWRFWLLGGLGLAAVITALSLMPAQHLPEAGLSDKAGHILAYVALAFWFGGITARRSYGWLALILIVYGVLIELLQAWMGWGRHAELYDIAADAAGIATGLLLALTPVGRWASWLESMQRQTAS